MVRVVPVDPHHPSDGELEAVVATLRSGGIVAQPTETFYALSVDAFDVRALREVNRLKHKPAASPILLLAADADQVAAVRASPAPPGFDVLVEAFWPGPLTLVVPAAAAVPAEVSGGRGTVAIRVPGLALPRRLAALLGRPLSGVSANLHGEAPSRDARAVLRALPEGLDLVLDGGTTPGGRPSTLVDLAGPRPLLLREGAVPASAVRSKLPDLTVRPDGSL